MDAVEKKEVKPDQFEKGTFKDTETVAGKYAAKNRKSCARIFTRKATAWKLSIKIIKLYSNNFFYISYQLIYLKTP